MVQLSQRFVLCYKVLMWLYMAIFLLSICFLSEPTDPLFSAESLNMLQQYTGGSFCIAGLVTQVPQEFYSFLQDVQSRLAKVIKSVGKIEHSLYPF